MNETSEARHAPHANHDIVVIGGSEGALEALKVVLAGLPQDLAASVLIVLHLGSVSYLTSILKPVSKLPVIEAVGGLPIGPGKVYVAVPGAHLMMHDSHLLLRRGPRENLTRPAIDPLFRSAAVTFGSRVIGVLLSGGLSDGTAGLLAIKRCGGLTIVQSPEDAVVPDMPRSALRHVDVDHVSGAAAIGQLLARLVGAPAGPTPAEMPVDLRLQAAIAAQELPDPNEKGGASRESRPRFACPNCGEALWEVPDESMLRLRCQFGHAFAADAVLGAQDTEIEVTLGRLLRAQREWAALARLLARRERRERRQALADELEARARDHEQGAQLVRQLMQGTASSRNGERPFDEEAED